MRGAAMRLNTAVRGFVVVVLSVSVVQSPDGWGVTYTSTQICAVKGSTVEIKCSYTYPSWIYGQTYKTYQTTKVQMELWFTKGTNHNPVDLKSDSDYTGRVEYRSNQKDCTLRITELRESDSAVYKFRFITNQQGGSYTGSPGVTLTVTDLQVQVITSQHGQDGTQVQLKCHSSCLPDHPSYVWMKNGQVILRETSSTLRYSFFPEDNISCALKGHEEFPSPSVYDPKPPSVSVSPSGEITEGSSVTLTCSSEANPAATYVWYKRNSQPLSKNSQLILSSIQSSDSGEYYCSAVNKLGSKRKSITIDVKYAPKLPSVSVSPSAEIVEGSSVTLTCSSDANPAASYTWYKEDEDSLKTSGHNFTISNIRPEHSGSYYCVAHNNRGTHNSTLQLTVVAGAGTLEAAGVTAAVLLPVIFFSVFLWIQKKRMSKEPVKSEDRANNREQCLPDQRQPEEQDDLQYTSIHFSNNQADPLYSNIRAAQPHRHMQEQEVTEYTAVRFNRGSAAKRDRSQETGESPCALYSTVNKTR
ncbi:B-cell receptor CD22-like isoform X2 [Oreochromis aureus]|uniref:B-cell receptor CD22-like isoform X2 n=1 Tax=Oreochromis aureus TaxID=47969 RepID=UPI00195439C3|nr:B-cell receptor CD22-like isoform X2 [Oreochromis aureus]